MILFGKRTGAVSRGWHRPLCGAGEMHMLLIDKQGMRVRPICRECRQLHGRQNCPNGRRMVTPASEFPGASCSVCDGRIEPGARCAHCQQPIPGAPEPKPGYFNLCRKCQKQGGLYIPPERVHRAV